MFAHDVPMGDGTTYTVKGLLAGGASNVKINKSDKAGVGIITKSLSLAPAKASGFNLCPSASKACIASCLFTSGLANVFPRTIQPPRIAKARMLRMFKKEFGDRLKKELSDSLKTAKRKGLKLAVRLNVVSDIAWEKEFPGMIESFPDIQFYDYTKIYNRMVKYVSGGLTSNYHLTFSWGGNNKDKCIDILNRGGNAAVPFRVTYHGDKRKPLPSYFLGFPIIDGDVTDMRFNDLQGGYIVGLRAKGKAKKDSSEFVIDPNSEECS